MAKIKCVYKMPGGPAHIGEAPNELAYLQFFVDGYIQAVPLSCGAVLLCNEDGKNNGMVPNFYLRDRGSRKLCDLVVGPVIVVAADGDEFVSLSDDLANQICEALNRQPELEVG